MSAAHSRSKALCLPCRTPEDNSAGAKGFDVAELAFAGLVLQKIYPAPRVGCALSTTLRFCCHHCNIPVGSCPICFIVLNLVVPTTTCEISGIIFKLVAHTSWNNLNYPILYLEQLTNPGTCMTGDPRSKQHERRTPPERSQT